MMGFLATLVPKALKAGKDLKARRASRVPTGGTDATGGEDVQGQREIKANKELKASLVWKVLVGNGVFEACAAPEALLECLVLQAPTALME